GRAGSCTDLTKARAARVTKANQRALDLSPTIEALRSGGAHSLRSIAAGLNSRGITTARGAEWSASQVQSLLCRIPCHAGQSAAPSTSSASVAKRRSEEHTSELQSLAYIVCRLLLEKKKIFIPNNP